MSLQERQKNLIKSILDISSQTDDFLTPAESEANAAGRWKVLILDTYTKQQITPLFNNSDLRKCGVTLHLQIGDKREPIKGVPAVYYVEPTEENVRRIVKDCSSPIYEVNYINFSSSISREMMTLFAQLCVENNCSQRINRVYDCYVGGIALEPYLFTFQRHHVYSLISSPHSDPAQIERVVGMEIPQELLSLVISMATVPTIRCSPNGAASMVASSLSSFIRDQLKSGVNLFQQNRTNRVPCLSHPLLVILDRDVDLISPLQHSSHYQPLVTDLLPCNNNRVIIPNSTSFYLDKSQDAFWGEYAYALFPDAIEANRRRMEEVMRQVESVRGLTGDAAATQHMKSAVESLPALLEQKKELEKHTTILKAVMEQINEREIPNFFDLENSLKADGKVDMTTFMQFLKSKGNLEDKIRLLCICVLCRDRDLVSQAETAFTEYLETLQGNDRRQADEMMKAFHYLKGFQSAKNASDRNATSTDNSIRSSFFKATTGIINLAKAGVKGILGDDDRSVVVQIVDELVNGRVSSLTETYGYYDPATGRTLMPSDGTKLLYEDVIVFIVGGGNYSEYQHLQVYAKSQNPTRTILYGSTDILAAKQFIPELQASCSE